MRRGLKSLISFCLTGAVVCGAAFSAYTRAFAAEINNLSLDEIIEYSEYSGRDGIAALPDYIGDDIICEVLSPDSFSTSLNEGIEKRTHEGNEYIYWTKETQWIEWKVNVPTDALYQIDITYFTRNESGMTAQRSLLINGEAPFSEATYIMLRTLWRSDTQKDRFNSAGDQQQYKQEQVGTLLRYSLTDAYGYLTAPFKIMLRSGENKIRLKYMEQDVGIKNIILTAPETAPLYSEIKSEYESDKALYINADREITFEAEKNIEYRNDASLREYADADPATEPFVYGYRRLNAFGGVSWMDGGQAVKWSFKVEKAGLYKLVMRAQNAWGEKLPVYREIRIDDKIPFEELRTYKFEYDSDWKTITLGDGAGDYLFYLTEGSHSLTMTAKLGPLAETISELENDAVKLNDLLLRITMVTGSNPDQNYDYKLKTRIPTIVEELSVLCDGIDRKINSISALGRGGESVISDLKQIRTQLSDFVKDPEAIPANISDFSDIIGRLDNDGYIMQSQGLALDTISFLPPETKVTPRESAWYTKFWATIYNVVISFFKDYSSIDSGDLTIEPDKVISVWTSAGGEWGTILQSHINEQFTAETGIGIQLKTIPVGQASSGQMNAVMLAVVGGNAPDVVLGLEPGTPVEFAMRNLAVDISKYKGFEEAASQFTEASLIPLRYKDGVYGLPQSLDFKVMFYRRDILSALNISPPNTWDDLYSKVLPVLYDNKLACYIPQDIGIFLFQNGGSFYTEDTLRCNLGTDEALMSFEQMVELNTRYGIPVTTYFYQRFRTGDIPLGVSMMGDYMQILIAAPELSGRWGIAPVPGTVKADGTIDRSVGGLVTQACTVVAREEKKKEMGWEFLKWWMGEEEQTRYGREIEINIGARARWNSANINAFKNQNWRSDDLEIITKCWEWERETRNVPGGYLSGREISNAWNRMLSGESMTLRDSLELAVENINLEMKQKQKEFNYTGINVN